jgi:hypothetical protein
MTLMRYWSPVYCDWRVALVTEAGEEVCTVLDIFFFHISPHFIDSDTTCSLSCVSYWLNSCFSFQALLVPSITFYFLWFFHTVRCIFALLGGLQTS